MHPPTQTLVGTSVVALGTISAALGLGEDAPLESVLLRIQRLRACERQVAIVPPHETIEHARAILGGMAARNTIDGVDVQAACKLARLLSQELHGPGEHG